MINGLPLSDTLRQVDLHPQRCVDVQEVAPVTPPKYSFWNNNFLKIPGNIARYLVRTNSTH